MAGNRGVAYMGPGKVEVHEIDYPKLELQDGPGVNPAPDGSVTGAFSCRGRRCPRS